MKTETAQKILDALLSNNLESTGSIILKDGQYIITVNIVRHNTVYTDQILYNDQIDEIDSSLKDLCLGVKTETTSHYYFKAD